MESETSKIVKFTVAIDGALLQRAKGIATRVGVSVNNLVNAELRHFLETFEACEASGNQNFNVLLDFSFGRTTSDDAMRALGLDREEDLFLLMAHGHLPMPRLADAATGEMVEQLRALPSH